MTQENKDQAKDQETVSDKWLDATPERKEIISLAMRTDKAFKQVSDQFGGLSFTVTLLYEALKQSGAINEGIIKKALESIKAKTERAGEIHAMQVSDDEKLKIAKAEGLDAYFTKPEVPQNGNRPRPS